MKHGERQHRLIYITVSTTAAGPVVDKATVPLWAALKALGLPNKPGNL